MEFKKLNELGVLTVAYLGDSIWELYIREYFVRKNINLKDLNIIVRKYVNAKFQSKIYLEILNEGKYNFLQEVIDYSKRARNAKIKSYPSSCTLKEYKNATALEALIGAYYLLNYKEELQEIIKIILEGDDVA
ncbi:MAG: mini-ribonuclease [Fusobacteriaceae bacterium]|jgi:ribonuclease-3 family protein|nr:hypothetical protein [Fusobacteriales bacterium]MDN5304847.1 mini-ribonuclease [Fusobacteriaceae bacterium]